MYAGPLERLARLEARAHWLEEGAVSEDRRVTVHARLGRRDAGEPRLLDRRVTVPAIDAVSGDVPLVAELDRLLARNVRFGYPRRTVDSREQEEKSGNEEDSAEDT